MREVFLTILRMGVVSGYVILVVLLVRRLLSHFPKRYSYLLWSVVFLRLVCPVGIKSAFSLIPDALFVEADSTVGGNLKEMHTAALLLAQRADNISSGGGNKGNAADGDGTLVFMAGGGYGNSGIAGADKESDKFGELEGAAFDGNAGVTGNEETRLPEGGAGMAGANPADGQSDKAGTNPQGGQSGKTGENPQDGQSGKTGTNPADGSVGGQDKDAYGTGGNGILTSAGSSGGAQDAIKTEDAGKTEDMTGRKDGSDAQALQGKGSVGVSAGLLTLFCAVWIVGILVFWLVWARSIRRFRKRLLGAVRVEEGVYETGQVAASFVDGIFRPVIYISAGLSGEARKCVLCHERVHVRRKDPLIKAAALFLVSIYWFHPLVWVAFKKMCEDMEMSCDERVVELLGAEIKKEYSSTLLQMAQEADEISLLAAFGGNEVKSRVKNVLSYRKPKTWLAILLLVVVAAVGIGLGLNPGSGKDVAASGSNIEGENRENGESDRQDGGSADLSGKNDTDGEDGENGKDTQGINEGKTPEDDGQSDKNMPDRPDSQIGGNENLPDPNEAEANSPVAKYASILQRYYLALEEKWNQGQLNEEGLSILTSYCYDGDALENVGFAFLDLNGDGQEELLIGAIAGDAFTERQVFQAWTMKDNEPWLVLSGRERSRYYLCEEEDGSFVFANEGSLGMANEEWDYCRVLQDGTLSVFRTILYDGMSEKSQWSTAVGADTETGEMSDAVEEEMQEIIKTYEAKYKKADYSPFADLDIQEMDAWEDAWRLRGTALAEQLNLILSQRELWDLTGDYLPEEIAYAVTDLDRNGRLELIAQACQGSGVYTHFYIYEVSEDGKDLHLCGRTLSEEYNSQADIMSASPVIPAYYHPETGQWNYIFIDIIRDGAAHYYETQWALNLKDGYLTEQWLASMATEYGDKGEDAVTTYQSGEFEGILVSNQEEYKNAADRAFEGCQKAFADIGWFGVPEEGTQADLAREIWYEKLREAYRKFSVRSESSETPQQMSAREADAKSAASTTSQKVSGENIESQLNLIVSRRELWERTDVYSAGEAKYTVTDLNGNGRLELVSATCQGTGHYTFTDVYEVSEDGNSLIHYENTVPEGSSQADLIAESAPVYYSRGMNHYQYIFDDLLRAGATYYYEGKRSWELSDGKILEETLAVRITEYTDGVPAIAYRSGDVPGVRVTSEEEYENAPDRAFATWQKGNAKFRWITMEEEGLTKEQEQKVWYEKLYEAQQGFFVGDFKPVELPAVDIEAAVSQEMGRQIRLILQEKDLWASDAAEGARYAITDLNQNGRLEILRERNRGAKFFFEVYEVSENLSTLVLCERLLTGKDADTILVYDTVPVYYDESKNQYQYIFEGIQNGTYADSEHEAYYAKSERALSLQDGKVTEKFLAFMLANTYQGKSIVTYAAGDMGKYAVTDKEDYGNAASMAFPGCRFGTVEFGWFQGYGEISDAGSAEENLWYRKMLTSYYDFIITLDGRAEKSAQAAKTKNAHTEFLEDWIQKAARQGCSNWEAIDWYARFQRAGMEPEKGDWPSDICFGDFDGNGVTDCFFAMNKHETMDSFVWWYRDADTVFWGSMNGEDFYHRALDGDHIAGMRVVAGDVNHDGFLELILGGDTGAIGAGGSFVIWQMLQYRDGKLVEQKMPSSKEWRGETQSSGYPVFVYETQKTKTCRAVLEGTGKEATFTVSGDSRFEYASYLDEHTPGWRDGKEAFGREGRGYTDAKIVRQDGRDYLLMKEYLIVTAATYGQIGYACLLFDWDENGDAYVKDFYVEPF